jgi:hypothetical protein
MPDLDQAGFQGFELKYEFSASADAKKPCIQRLEALLKD